MGWEWKTSALLFIFLSDLNLHFPSPSRAVMVLPARVNSRSSMHKRVPLWVREFMPSSDVLDKGHVWSHCQMAFFWIRCLSFSFKDFLPALPSFTHPGTAFICKGQRSKCWGWGGCEPAMEEARWGTPVSLSHPRKLWAIQTLSPYNCCCGIELWWQWQLWLHWRRQNSWQGQWVCS